MYMVCVCLARKGRKGGVGIYRWDFGKEGIQVWNIDIWSFPFFFFPFFFFF